MNADTAKILGEFCARAMADELLRLLSCPPRGGAAGRTLEIKCEVVAEGYEAARSAVDRLISYATVDPFSGRKFRHVPAVAWSPSTGQLGADPAYVKLALDVKFPVVGVSRSNR